MDYFYDGNANSTNLLYFDSLDVESFTQYNQILCVFQDVQT